MFPLVRERIRVHKSYSWIPNEKINKPLFKWCILAQESKHCSWSMERMSWVSSTKSMRLNESIQMLLLQLFHSTMPEGSVQIIFLWMLFKPVLFGENDLSSVMNYEWLVAVWGVCFLPRVASWGPSWPWCSSSFVVLPIQVAVPSESVRKISMFFFTHQVERSRNSLHFSSYGPLWKLLWNDSHGKLLECYNNNYTHIEERIYWLTW